MRVPRSILAPVFVLGALSASCAGRTGPVTGNRTEPALSADDLRHRLFLIADDSTMGRESGSRGAQIASEYVASEFRRLGLEPAGEDGTYFQTVPFWRAAVDPRSRLEADGTVLELGRDFLPVSVSARSHMLDGKEVIYGGPLSDSTRWITPAQASGKLVVLLPASIGTRGSGVSPARWRGAAAVAVMALDRIGAEQQARLREGQPVADSAPNPLGIPILAVSRRAAMALLVSAPESLASGAAGRPVRGQFGVTRTPVAFPARNVVAILRGSDPSLRAEYVALTAHHDHVGFDHFPVDHDSLRAFNSVVRPMGADSPPRDATPAEWVRIRARLDSLRRLRPARPDSIRNGADDDGSGTASILEIAEWLSRGTARPRRSILFVSHTGEEAGLLGSRWFTDHPTVPLDSVVAEIDQDMVGRGTASDFPRGGTGAGSATYLEVVGATRLSREFGAALDSANARQPTPFVFDLSYDQPDHPLQYYCRADHYSYARYGIPSLAISRGEHLDYHQVTDEAQYISYPDLLRVTRLVTDAALRLANADRRPRLDVPKPSDPHGPCRQ